jgi:hypothetical protein
MVASLFQTPQNVQRISNFFPTGTGIALSCSSSSSSIQLPTLPVGSSATDIMIVNNGANAAFIAFGQTAPTAVVPTSTAANGICIPPGVVMVLSNSPLNTYVAGITASSTTTLYFYQGYGS